MSQTINHCSVTDASGWREVYHGRCLPDARVLVMDPCGEYPRDIWDCEFDWEYAIDEDLQAVIGTCAHRVCRKVEPVCSSRVTFICAEGV